MGFNLITTDGAGLPGFLQELGGYQDEGLSAGIAARAPKIGVSTDKHFTITRDGMTTVLETVMTDAAGKQHAVPVQSINIIIVAASGTLTKAWYESSYVPGSNAAPECYSNDGRVPAPGVAKPQFANCAQCPKNAFGSHPVTGRGKACADRKMVVCVWDGAPDELMTWNVSTTSLQALQKFDAELRNANIPMQSVLVQLSFDPSVIYPVIKISALGFVDKETTLRLKEASQSAEVMSLLRETEYEPVQAAQSPVPQNTIQFGQGAAAGTPAPEQQAPGQEAPKRTRRTKAQIEADRAAAAATQPQAGTEIQLDTPLEQIKEEEKQILGGGEEDPVAALQAQLAAAIAAQQAAKQTTQVQQQPDQTPEPETAPVQPSGNVAALLSAWATKKN